MANINLVRRAEIGREKRAKTRALLVAAAKLLFAKQAVGSVTVDDVVGEAGVAKGTFYVHFDGLEALIAAVAEELVRSFDDLLQPVRLSIADPAVRIALGCRSFIDKALADSRWAGLVARMSAVDPNGGVIARSHLLEDLQLVLNGMLAEGTSAELNLEIVTGIMLQTMRAVGEGRVSSHDRDPIVSAILRAIGLNARQTNSVLARLPKVHSGAMLEGARANSARRSTTESSAA